MTRRILILGGTTEAKRLAGLLGARSDLDVVLSLAGRTKDPAPQPVPVRTGGFGGVDGLAAYLEAEAIDVLVDATHPYAAQISRNAARAAGIANVPLVALRRPPWERQEGDRWHEVASWAEAMEHLGPEPRRVFLALGRQEVGAFEAAPRHVYVIRSVDPIDPPLRLPHVTYVLGRGPFNEAEDRVLLEAHGIDAVVAKNSGGTATYGKIAAARALGIEVVLLQRPAVPETATAATVEEALQRVDHAAASRAERGV